MVKLRGKEKEKRDRQIEKALLNRKPIEVVAKEFGLSKIWVSRIAKKVLKQITPKKEKIKRISKVEKNKDLLLSALKVSLSKIEENYRLAEELGFSDLMKSIGEDKETIRRIIKIEQDDDKQVTSMQLSVS